MPNISKPAARSVASIVSSDHVGTKHSPSGVTAGRLFSPKQLVVERVSAGGHKLKPELRTRPGVAATSLNRIHALSGDRSTSGAKAPVFLAGDAALKRRSTSRQKEKSHSGSETWDGALSLTSRARRLFSSGMRHRGRRQELSSQKRPLHFLRIE